MGVHLAKGTRDFLPPQMNRRLKVIETVRAVFRRYGFEPLETPAFERIETLMGKYGDEGEKLVFKILKRGKGGERGECDQALRYDLTVPLARVIAMNGGLRLPFKRYQIQPVWRADRPQKGRFREFYQCDVDIVGSTHAAAEAECLAVVAESLKALGFEQFTIRLNDRRILRGIARQLDAEDRETDLLIAIDKLDKIGEGGVSDELLQRGFSPDQISTLWTLLDLGETDDATLAHLSEHLDDEGNEGVTTLRTVLEQLEALGIDRSNVQVDPTLARGLDYYTGPVFETVVDEPKVGSISGGGRYDGLIGMFSGREVPAVGVSLGLERIIAVMEELGMLDDQDTTTEVLVTVFSPELRTESTRVAAALRAAGIDTDLFLDDKKLGKQFKYANARGYPWVVVIGPGEADEGKLTLKNLRTGDQDLFTVAEAIERLTAA